MKLWLKMQKLYYKQIKIQLHLEKAQRKSNLMFSQIILSHLLINSFEDIQISSASTSIEGTHWTEIE